MASIGSNKELEATASTGKSQRTSLIFNLDNKEDFTLCSLTVDKVEQQALDLVMTEGETIAFRVEGPHSIHLSGYYINEDEEHDDFINDDDEVFSDEAEEDSQIEYDSELEDEDFSGSESEVEIRSKKNPRIRVLESDEEEDSEFDSEDDEELDSEDDDEMDSEDEDEMDSEDDEEMDSEDEESEEEMPLKEAKKVKFDLSEAKKAKQPVKESPALAKAAAVPAKVAPTPAKAAAVPAKVTPTPAKADVAPAKVTPTPAQPAPTKAAAAPVAAKPASPSQDKEQGPAPVKKTLPSGLQIEDLKLGAGAKVSQGKKVLIHYKGTLLNGSVFDSSFGGKPLKFAVGKSEVIKGMDIGIVGMAVGGSRKLVIPGPLAYGNQALPKIPRNSTLVFEIRLEKIL